MFLSPLFSVLSCSVFFLEFWWVCLAVLVGFVLGVYDVVVSERECRVSCGGGYWVVVLSALGLLVGVMVVSSCVGASVGALVGVMKHCFSYFFLSTVIPLSQGWLRGLLYLVGSLTWGALACVWVGWR